MFSKSPELDGMKDILQDIGYLSELKNAGEDQEHKYPKKSGKKSKDFDGDGEVEDETDEYAGVKDRAIKKAMGKVCDKCGGKGCEHCKGKGAHKCSTKVEHAEWGIGQPILGQHAVPDSVDGSIAWYDVMFEHGVEKNVPTADMITIEEGSHSEENHWYAAETILEELTDEDLLFLSDDLIEEVIEEVFEEYLEEGFEIEEVETFLTEQIDAQMTLLSEASDSYYDSAVKSSKAAARKQKLDRIKAGLKKVGGALKSGAKAAGKAAARGAGYASGVAQRAASSAKDEFKKGRERGLKGSGSSSSSDSSSGSSSSSSSGGSSSSGSSATGSKRPGILGRVAGALKRGIKKAVYSGAKAAGKVVKTAKAGYRDGAGSSSSSKVTTNNTASQEKKPVKKKPSMDELIKQVRNEGYKEIDREKRVKMYRKAGNAARAGQTDRMNKFVSAINNHSDNRGIQYPTGEKKQTSVAAKKANLKREEVEIEEGLKQARANVGMNPDKPSCWKGYEAKGTKMKGGKEVPNCVPKEEWEDLHGDLLEEGYEEMQIVEIIEALENGFDVIFEEDGAYIQDEVEELTEEDQFYSDIEMVADFLAMEGVIESEEEFFALMEELSEEDINNIYELAERYKGKHGQSDKEYADSRSQGGKMVSGDSKQSGAEYTHGRRVKAANPGMQPDVGGKTKPKSQGKMDKGTRADLEYRKANLKKEDYEMIGDSLDNGGLEVRTYSWREVMALEGYKEIDQNKHSRMYDRYKKLRSAAIKDAQDSGEASGTNRMKMGKMSSALDKSAENLRKKQTKDQLTGRG